MLKSKLSAKIILSFIGYLVITAAFPAQAQRELRGRVYLLGAYEELQPVANTTVRLENTNDTAVTTATGEFRFALPQVFKTGETVTLRVAKEGHQILQPLGGQVRLPAEPQTDLVEIQLAEVGSYRFLSRAAFGLLIEHIAHEVKTQLSTRDSDRPNFTGDRDHPKPDFSLELKEWARQYGRGPDEVQAALDAWAEEVKTSLQDFCEAGLAAFYQKDFGRAADQFSLAAERYAAQLDRFAKLRKSKAPFTQPEREIRGKLSRAYRLAGDAYCSAYQFKSARWAYQGSLMYVDRNENPQQWAVLTNNLSMTYINLAIQEGEKTAQQYLADAVAGCQAVLAIYPRETNSPDWAMAQYNLGNARREQALLAAEAEQPRLFQDALAALKNALAVRTYDRQPRAWAQTQSSLAVTYDTMADWPNAIASYVNVLKVYPTARDPYRRACSIYHDRLFQFEAAYLLNFKWVHEFGHNDVGSVAELIENSFTTARFPEVAALLAEILPEMTPEHHYYLLLHAYEVANLVAQARMQAIPAELNALTTALEQKPTAYQLHWTFLGTKHFLQESHALTAQREWLLAFFTALEGANRDAILQGLRTAQKAFEK